MQARYGRNLAQRCYVRTNSSYLLNMHSFAEFQVALLALPVPNHHFKPFANNA